MNKKAQADSYDVSSRFGYYVFTIMTFAVLFMLVGFFTRSTDIRYYRSDYGVGIMNMEERAFEILAYSDEITEFTYSKIIDFNKMRMSQNNFSNKMGFSNDREYRGVKVVLFNKNQQQIESIETINFYDQGKTITNIYPVLYYEGNDIFKVGKVGVTHWMP